MSTTWDSSNTKTSTLLTLSNGNLSVDDTIVWKGIGVAYDFGAHKFWVYDTYTGLWNGRTLSLENPATGTGGLSYGSGSTAYFPGWSGNGNLTDKTTANFGGSTFQLAVPSGFSAFDATATWNTSRAGPHIQFSNSNLTVECNNTGGSPFFGWETVFATTSKTTGKFYWELSYDIVDANFIVGIGDSSAVISGWLGFDTHSAGLQSNNSKYQFTGGVAFTYGQVLSWRVALGTVGKTSGKLVWEYTINAQTGPSVSSLMGGFADASIALGTFLGSDVNGIGFQPNGDGTHTEYYYNAGGAVLAADAKIATGSTIMVAIDFTNKKWWPYNPGTAQWFGSGIGLQNPATNTGGVDITSLVAAGTLFPAVAMANSAAADKITANFSGSFSNPVPSGFTAWDPAIVYTISTVQGSYTLTGETVTLNTGKNMFPAQGIYTLTGEPINFTKAKILTAIQGIYTLTGKTATLNSNRSIFPTRGLYTLTGNSVTFTDLISYVLSPITGIYNLLKNSISLTKTSPTPTPPVKRDYDTWAVWSSPRSILGLRRTRIRSGVTSK